MKSFFSAAYCFLMYAFIAYLWLLFITAVLDRTRFLNHSFLEAGVILIGTILFFCCLTISQLHLSKQTSIESEGSPLSV
ncbi:hypothetical protein [Bacillus paralicheniformis]|uniref:hypothetical protein n=1 Tax=Bacillus paralicheniformis TaxID=1648923 RepID=UPI0021D2A304|nr:hypothetical protein [Bacillus paralicheniformis]MCU4669515.1 hypothetical protein [Bacillus paralicheniformis]